MLTSCLKDHPLNSAALGLVLKLVARVGLGLGGQSELHPHARCDPNWDAEVETHALVGHNDLVPWFDPGRGND